MKEKEVIGEMPSRPTRPSRSLIQTKRAQLQQQLIAMFDSLNPKGIRKSVGLNPCLKAVAMYEHANPEVSFLIDDIEATGRLVVDREAFVQAVERWAHGGAPAAPPAPYERPISPSTAPTPAPRGKEPLPRGKGVLPKLPEAENPELNMSGSKIHVLEMAAAQGIVLHVKPEEENAALQIQSVASGRAGSRVVADAQKNDAAAVKIQAVARGKASRDTAQKRAEMLGLLSEAFVQAAESPDATAMATRLDIKEEIEALTSKCPELDELVRVIDTMSTMVMSRPEYDKMVGRWVKKS